MPRASTVSTKWELIYPQGPWRGLDDVEFATLGYIDWFNHRRLHGEITADNTYVTQAEFESAYYRQDTRPSRRLPNSPNSHGNRGGPNCFMLGATMGPPGGVR